MEAKYVFETEMEVRDYECDIQGIVNNANYLHYTEHTRHLYLQSLGVNGIWLTPFFSSSEASPKLLFKSSL